MRKVRTLRHWKQRFDKNAEFIWRRPTTYAGKACVPGDMIPQDLADKPLKLRTFWEANVIELALFEAPNVKTGLVDEKPVVAEEGPDDGITRDGRNYVVGDQKFTSRKKALAFIADEAAKNDAPDSADGSGADTVPGSAEDFLG